MHAWKEPTPAENRGPRRCVSPEDVDAVTGPLGFIPFDRDPVRHVLATQAELRREPAGTHRRETDDADARDRAAVHELRAKRRRNEICGDLRVEAVRDEQTTPQVRPDP
jgi:hypothetical protein